MIPEDQTALEAAQHAVEVAGAEERLRRRAERTATRLAWRDYAEEILQIEARTVRTLGAKFRRDRALSPEEIERLSRATTRLTWAARSYVLHSEKGELEAKKPLAVRS